MGFTKLDERILQSSIMAEDGLTFKVWVALMAACESNGIAYVSPLFLASICHAPLNKIQASIEKLEKPDPYSRTLIDEGRRIKRVNGGYQLVNYKFYRTFSYSDSPEAIRQRRHRERDAPLRVTKPRDISASASASDSYSSIKEDNFLTWWERYPRKVARKVAARAYAAAIKAGAEPEDLIRAVDGYRAHLKKNNTEERFCQHPSTFLHEERWRDYLDAPSRPLQVGEAGDVASSVARAVARNRKNFPELGGK